MASSLSGFLVEKRLAAATQEAEAAEEEEEAEGSLPSILEVVACGRTSWDISSKREAMDCKQLDQMFV
jgi:hypothetical protein